jgi:hypothetical protein
MVITEFSGTTCIVLQLSDHNEKVCGETLPNTCTQAVFWRKSRKLLSLAVLVRNVSMEHAMLLKWERDREECSAIIAGFVKKKVRSTFMQCWDHMALKTQFPGALKCLFHENKRLGKICRYFAAQGSPAILHFVETVLCNLGPMVSSTLRRREPSVSSAVNGTGFEPITARWSSVPWIALPPGWVRVDVVWTFHWEIFEEECSLRTKNRGFLKWH